MPGAYVCSPFLASLQQPLPCLARVPRTLSTATEGGRTLKDKQETVFCTNKEDCHGTHVQCG